MSVKILTRFSEIEPKSLLVFAEGATSPRTPRLTLSFQFDFYSETLYTKIADMNEVVIGLSLSTPIQEDKNSSYSIEVPILTNRSATSFLRDVQQFLVREELQKRALGHQNKESIFERLKTFCESRLGEYEVINWRMAASWIREITHNPGNQYEEAIAKGIKDINSYSTRQDLMDLQNMIVAYSYMVTPRIAIVGLWSYLVHTLVEDFKATGTGDEMLLPRHPIRVTRLSGNPLARHIFLLVLSPETNSLFVTLPSVGPAAPYLLSWVLPTLREEEVNDKLNKVLPHMEVILDTLADRDISSNRYEEAYKNIVDIIKR